MWMQLSRISYHLPVTEKKKLAVHNSQHSTQEAEGGRS